MVNVIGLGYIGLPTALMLASHGVDVVGTDYNAELVKTLNSGRTTFQEKGLDALFQQAVADGIVFTTEYQATDTYIVSVPTPYDSDTKLVDMQFVVNAVKSVLDVCLDNALIIIESTVSPGSIDHCIRPLVDSCPRSVRLAHAPERIIPGNMVYELIHNNRTVGADSPDTAAAVKTLYSTFCEGEIVLTDIKTAEMTKVVENTYRAVNIAFANELAKICRKDGLDVYEIIRICNMHPRVNVLTPGPGVGGHCISVDPWFLVGDFPKETMLINAAMQTNAAMPQYVYRRIETIAAEKGITDFSRIGLYGLTYKENVDDIRESPTLQLLDWNRQQRQYPFRVYDPYINKDLVSGQHHSLQEFLSKVDMVVVMVGHHEIKEKETTLVNKVVLDCRNVITLPDAYHL